MSDAEARRRLSRRMRTTLRTLSGNDALGVSLLWDPERKRGDPDAPAWFSRAKMRVSINAPFALQGRPPGEVNPLTVAGRRKDPVLLGLACHEAAHVRSTLWDPSVEEMASADPAVRYIATLLEEPRIERRHLQERPQDRHLLRAQSVLMDVAPFSDSGEGAVVDGGMWRASTLCVLTMARSDAGVLDPEDVEGIERALRGLLGPVFDRLADLWREALDLEDGDVVSLLDVAERWVALVGVPPSGQSLSPSCAAEAPGESEFAKDWSADEDGPTATGVLVAAWGSMQASVCADLDLDAEAEQFAQATEDEAAAAAEADQESRKTQEGDQRVASAFLENGRAPRVRWANENALRPPRPDERLLAVRAGEAIARARFRGRKVSLVRQSTPPGRLQGRDAMLGDAQRSMHMPITAEPFLNRVSRYEEEPPLSVGLMADLSGSMSGVVEEVSSMAWALAYAMTYVDGRMSSVGFGADVSVLSVPEQPPEMVSTLVADSGYQNFPRAFAFLDGMLNLTHGTGARLLFVISDGIFSEAEAEGAREGVLRAIRGGARIVWFTMSDREHAIQHFPVGYEHSVVEIDPQSGEMWEQAVRALESALRP